MNIFKKGAFSYDPNMTPQQLADKRAMLAMLQPKYGKASYIGEGLGQLATGVATGIRTRKLDEIEGKGREQGANLFSGLFGGTTQSTSGQSGPMNILGVDPGYGGASSAPPGSPGHTANDGHDHSDWLKYTNQGATRNQPIKPELVSAMSFLPELGLTMEVYSGGQPGIGDGGARVGSTRHDHGGAADVMFRDATGRMLDWNNPDDLPVLTEIVRRAKAAGVTGIGAGDDYMGAGRMHIGFGDPGVWGAGGKGANAPDWLRAAYEGGGLPGGPVAAPAGASTATNSAIPSIDPQALAAALANPWLSPEERSVLTTIYDQQVQAGDPLRQIEVAKGMAELDKMNAPAPPPEELLTRMALLDAAGVDRNSPEGQTYLLTGKMPGGGEEFTLSEGQTRFGPNGEVIAQGPAKPGYRPMTPQEVTATPGLDPGKAWQVSPDGKIEQIGGGGVTVNNSIDGGGKFEEAFAKGDAETIGTVYDAGLAATRNLGRIDQLETLLQGAPSGMGGRLAQMAGEWGLAIDGTDAVQAAQAMINSLVPEQRPAGSGPMSDADLELFKQSLPRIINTPGGNQMIVDTMRAIAQYDAQGAEIVQRMRLPEGDPNRLTRAEAFQMLQERQNPLSAFKGQAGAVPATAAPAAGGGTTINGYTIKPVN